MSLSSAIRIHFAIAWPSNIIFIGNSQYKAIQAIP
jgi:hypothetical protein